MDDNSEIIELPYTSIDTAINVNDNSINNILNKDVYALTCTQSKNPDIIAEAQDVIFCPDARQLLDKAVGDVILDSQSPPKNSSLKSCNISMLITDLLKCYLDLLRIYLIF